jgi:hypothetical protein
MSIHPKHFKNISYMGIPTFKVYVVDEEQLNKLNNKSMETESNSFQRYLCYSK